MAEKCDHSLLSRKRAATNDIKEKVDGLLTFILIWTLVSWTKQSLISQLFLFIFIMFDSFFERNQKIEMLCVYIVSKPLRLIE